MTAKRMEFAIAAASGDYEMAELCRSFKISRPTGYKWLHRYAAGEGFENRSSAPSSQPGATPEDVVQRIVAEREAHPCWGARKIHHRLKKELGGRLPAKSTIGAILKREGLIPPRKRRLRYVPYTQPFVDVHAANDLWCVDFKGDIKVGSRFYKPLTVTDSYSRFILFCDILPSTRTQHVAPVFASLFRRHGRPGAIRSDNGTPFAGHGLGGLSKLSVGWWKLGITVERIAPGKPQQNGRHERMHGALKTEAATPPQPTLAEQRSALERFRTTYNEQRPHEALDDEVPANIYQPPARRSPERVARVRYPSHWATRKVDASGKFSWRDTGIRCSRALVAETVGLEPITEFRYGLWFAALRLGTFDAVKMTIYPAGLEEGLNEV